MFSRLVAFSWKREYARAPSRMSRENCASSCRLPGPMIMLRDALPKVPVAGTVNAAVLKNRSIVGSFDADRRRRCSRRAGVLLVPRATSAASRLHARRVGRARLPVKVARRPPVLEQPRPEARRCSATAIHAERQLELDVGGELVSPIEARKTPLGIQVLVVLRDDRRRRHRSSRRCRATARACTSRRTRRRGPDVAAGGNCDRVQLGLSF